ncbi:LOW QUALITY PROTEIN: hypothetical protein OSB04_000781 [Centaurea solstitialis]|uniref:Uncharacterized protein n=1 Tax=Centaurea solstitialis TaxID=347529 RepID=A0AA38WSA4_9ASTR|nr:LOW QUALITY PROTEIN: hypothetical protein OSB04_000781 [Centaurea solstitialis]
MYGRLEGELWLHRWHMWPVLSSSTPSSSVAASPSNSFVFIDTNSFSKGGRKIHVGDCALFKPSHNSLPFVGIIRRLIVGEKDNLRLSVNWLYRPADIKLEKGAVLEAAPNEVFYSFHKDEIPAASLLHPCKVTFLRKVVELPSGISSFVCRRVYDIESKRLWWLTDQDYINERQEEVDQLLDKTRIEMYGGVQTGGRSPKPLNGPNGTTAQLKPSSDNVQNSSSSISSHAKSKRREHSVHNSDSVKRERLSKIDDADSGQHRPEHIIKTEISKITDKGGLVDFGGVEKLIQLMRPESAEKKPDLACRAMLVDVISGTERFDCLGRFVQLRGLSVLDEWLQEIHKGKIGDGSPKENDKSVEEFLFSLLRALDRLPVNLHALQTCNVGKSVNHLRSHKNSEIREEARSLVSTWKSRVEAEMNIIETKSSTSRGGGFWPSKSMIAEVSPMGGRRIGGGSSEAGIKSPTSQPSALKVQQPKHNFGEAVTKSPASPSSTKLSTMAAAKEGRSCSPSQSPNNSQSCSSDHGKAAASCREDARSSAGGSSSVSKISSSVSHGRNSSNGFHGSTTIPGVQKEGSLGKIGSVNRNFASEKGSPTRYPSERVSDASLVDNGNSQRLIVRLPNTVRSPARTVSGESPEDSSTISGKVSVVVPSEKLDQKVSGKIDGNLSQGKDGLVGRDEVKVATVRSPFDERGRTTEASLGGSGPSSSGVTPKAGGKLYEASYSSINALVESCAKFSEASVSPSVGDDVGMNLLASVAAGEMSRSDVSPACSPRSNSPLPEDSCSANVAKLRPKDNINVANGHTTTTHISADSKDASFSCELKTREDNTQSDSPTAVLPQSGGAVDLAAPEVKPAGLMDDERNGCKEGDGAVQSDNQRKFSPNWSQSVNFSNMKPNSGSPSSDDDKNAGCAEDKEAKNNVLPDAAATSAKIESQINEESASWSSSDMHVDDKKLIHKQSNSQAAATTSCGDVDLVPKSEEADGKKAERIERQNMDSGTSVSDQSSERADEPLAPGGGSVAPNEPPATGAQELRSCEKASDVAETGVKLDFDLNEVLPNDDGIQGEVERTVQSTSLLPSNNGNRSPLITVAAAAKGPFCSSENLSRGKTELGWKGSAATSAFRPAEPRKTADVPVPDNHSGKQARPFLDFDLNVGAIEDAGPNNRAVSGGGLDLDLNACEESGDVVQLSVFNGGRPGGGMEQLPPPRSLQSSRGFFNPEPNSSRGFDLNNGPGVEEVAGGEAVSFTKNGMQFLSAVPNVRMNNMDIGNFSPWFPPNNAYPAITIPSILPGRGDPSYPVAPAAVSQRMLTPVTAATSLNPELFRGGPVLSSSPAVAYSSTVPFQYSAFPFETNYSLPSISNTFSAVSTAYVDSSSSGGALCFPNMPSQTQLVGPNGVVSMPYRPYFMSLPGGGPGNMGPDGRKWGSQGLDLNAGPGGGADDKLASGGFRPIALAGSQAMDDEQLKIFQQMAAGGGVSKRKEPDGGWDGDRINYKRHPSWQ